MGFLRTFANGHSRSKVQMGSKLIAEFRVARNLASRPSGFQRCKNSITLESHDCGQLLSASPLDYITVVVDPSDQVVMAGHRRLVSV